MKPGRSVDEYIRTSAKWRDELIHLRSILSSTGLTEEVKWGAPCYTYNGKNVVGLVAFNSYVGLWFHQGALLKDDKRVLVNAQEGKTKALRQWRMCTASDIKPSIVKRYVKEAIQLVEAGTSIRPAINRPIRMPEALVTALQRNRRAARKFDTMTFGKQREFADYVAAAKRETTRQSRIEKVLPMIIAGEGLNDKYR